MNHIAKMALLEVALDGRCKNEWVSSKHTIVDQRAEVRR